MANLEIHLISSKSLSVISDAQEGITVAALNLNNYASCCGGTGIFQAMIAVVDVRNKLDQSANDVFADGLVGLLNC